MQVPTATVGRLVSPAGITWRFQPRCQRKKTRQQDWVRKRIGRQTADVLRGRSQSAADHQPRRRCSRDGRITPIPCAGGSARGSSAGGVGKGCGGSETVRPAREDGDRPQHLVGRAVHGRLGRRCEGLSRVDVCTLECSRDIYEAANVLAVAVAVAVIVPGGK